MNPILILFSISLVGVLGMIGIRKMELRLGRLLVPAVCRFCLDNTFSKIGFAILTIIARIKKLVVTGASTVPHKTKMTLAQAWSKVRMKVDGYFEVFHRHHVSGTKGPMSDYWKSMHDHKDSLKK